MKRKLTALLMLLGMVFSLPAYAEQGMVAAEAEVQTEGNIFSRAWSGIKGFFKAEEKTPEARAEEPAQAAQSAKPNTQATAEAEADVSLVDKAAESTKAGVDWTAEKAKQGAEWTKETAKGVTKATGKGVKKVGEAIEGLFPTPNDTTVDAEAGFDAEVEHE